MLRAQPEQDDASRIHVDRHDRGAARHQLLAFQPSGRDDVRVRISRDDRRALGDEPFRQREERTVVVEPVRLRRHAVANRVRRIDLHAQDRAGREMLIA